MFELVMKEWSVSIVKAKGESRRVEKSKEGNDFQEGILAFSSST